MRDFREYRGYVIEKVTSRDWFVTDPNGNAIYAENGRVPYTLKEAKAVIDLDIKKNEFMEQAIPTLCIDITDNELDLNEIVEAVQTRYKGWHFSHTTIKLNHGVEAVFKPFGL